MARQRQRWLVRWLVRAFNCARIVASHVRRVYRSLARCSNRAVLQWCTVHVTAHVLHGMPSCWADADLGTHYEALDFEDHVVK